LAWGLTFGENAIGASWNFNFDHIYTRLLHKYNTWYMLQITRMAYFVLLPYRLEYAFLVHSLLGTQHKSHLSPIPKPSSISNISARDVLEHVQRLLEFTEMDMNYEASRAKAVDYIVQVLTSSSGKLKIRHHTKYHLLPFANDLYDFNSFVAELVRKRYFFLW
jgi:hypothetical protein